MIAVITRVTAGLFGATAGVLWLLCVYVVASSVLSTDPASDPHGFGLMFGTVVGTISGLLFAVVLPAVFPAARRRLIARICMAIYIVTMALLFLTMYVA
jgi:hypothetical protein